MASSSDSGGPSGCSSGFTDEPDPPRESQSQKSLLDVLKWPDPSMLARKRVINCKPPIGAKKVMVYIALKSDPKGVSPSDRLKEFPNECLQINFHKKHFCEACREVVSHKKNTLQTHLKTNKHKKGKKPYNGK